MVDRNGLLPREPDTSVLHINGIPTLFGNGDLEGGFLKDPMGSWRPLAVDGLDDVEAECLLLHDELAASIFGSLNAFVWHDGESDHRPHS